MRSEAAKTKRERHAAQFDVDKQDSQPETGDEEALVGDSSVDDSEKRSEGVADQQHRTGADPVSWSPLHFAFLGGGLLLPEKRATSTTGGQKGRKLEEYALIPAPFLAEVARVYGYGAKKYAPHNWRKGYPYSWALSALMRHIEAFRMLESKDSESGLHHLAHAAFHLATLFTFEAESRGADDRAYHDKEVGA